MGKFNGLSPKPHIVFSNDREMVVSLCRKAGHMQKSDFAKCPVHTAKTYVDKNGVKRSVGLKKEMRESQHLGWNLEFLDYWIRIMKSISFKTETHNMKGFRGICSWSYTDRYLARLPGFVFVMRCSTLSAYCQHLQALHSRIWGIHRRAGPSSLWEKCDLAWMSKK